MTPPLFDAHNHLQDERLRAHRAVVFADLEKSGVRGAVVNGTREADWESVALLAREHAWIVPSFGLHPWHVRGRSPSWLDDLRRHLDGAGPRAAVGEIGLDRWIENHDDDDQRRVFIAQMRLAAARDAAVSIHCLQAWGALAEVLREEAVPARGFLIHAYGGPKEMVAPFSGRGAYFSFNGYFLHARKEARREIFRTLPIERLLVETDAPDMPPPPDRAPFALPSASAGTPPPNHPANLAETYRALAELRGVSVEILATQVGENFHRLFG